MALTMQAKVQQVLTEEFGVPENEIAFDVPYGELSFDSLMVLELALSLETELDVTITEDEIGSSRTLSGFVELLESKQEVSA